MFKLFLKFIKNPLTGPFSISIFLLGMPYLETFFLNISKSFLFNYILLFLLNIILVELIFRISYKIYNGTNYLFIKSIPFEKLYVEPHPYLPYTYKKNFNSAPSELYNYPLHKNFFSANLKTNNFGFYNGPNGDRDIQIPKPQNLFRISCLGGSTTANYISDGQKNFSYPLELETILKKKKENIEVNNCGTGGYNSADLLVRFLLQTIETKPNLVVIYHAYNDIRSYLTENFKTDYSHSRIGLGENYWKFKLNSFIPNIPLKFINYLKNNWVPSNVRYSLLEIISKGKINLNIDYTKGLKTYERNIQNLINVCVKNNIDVVLSTYCFYLHKKAEKSNLNKIYETIVLKENEIIKNLAKKNNLKIVDCNSKIPKDNEFFVDTVHLTPKGMKFIANEIGKVINP